MMLFIPFFILLAACRLVFTTSHHTNDDIWQSRIDSIANYPFLASIQYEGQHLCGGSVVSANYILTAAYCTTGNVSRYAVRLGSSYHHTGGTVYSVSQIILNKGFDPATGAHDIALLKTSTIVIFSMNVKAVALARSGATTSPGTTATIIGWKSASEGSVGLPFSVAVVAVSSDTICASYYGPLVSSSIICTSANPSYSCEGFLGGPLMTNGEQIGILSWRNGCANSTAPKVYMRVSSYRTWITANTGV